MEGLEGGGRGNKARTWLGGSVRSCLVGPFGSTEGAGVQELYKNMRSIKKLKKVTYLVTEPMVEEGAKRVANIAATQSAK